MSENITPIRQQYLRIKRQYPNVILFFRLGDFYETFDEDARITSKELEIVLTSRGMGKGHSVPMAGIPYHAVDNYLAKLISRGYKVAICEQITRPGETKGIVQREVVRLVTPGTVVEPGLLNSKTNNYLVSLVVEGESGGLAYADITTGEFAVTQIPVSRITGELDRLRPAEIVIPESLDISVFKITAPVTRLDDFDYNLDSTTRILLDHFGVVSLDGYGCGNLPLAIRAAGGIIKYLKETQKTALSLLTGLSTYSTANFMALDIQTQNNLELFRSSRTGKPEGSLLEVIDRTRTPMGGRMLRSWLGQPLLDVKLLNQRLDAVQWFFDETLVRKQLINLLGNIGDLERLVNRIKSRIASPREVVTLRRSLELVPELRKLLEKCPLDWLKSDLIPLPEIVDLLKRALVDQPPSGMDEGGVINPGFSPELDEIRSLSINSKQYLAGLERREKERTGIKSLKVGYNRVFGYYIEVSNANLSQVPPDYIRKQTLTGGERFYTPELKEYETRIVHAQERIVEIETDLFYRVCGQIASEAELVLKLARAVAMLDVFSSLAEVAVNNNYTRPELNEGTAIEIKEGRHPVVEKNLPPNAFIPNDTFLSCENARIIILTGPNMSGKSTYLRQVALIVLLAQIGSFVPAASARIGVVDRIFTRIGAGEDLAAGKSTFMVEMTETAIILNSATRRSLIILDEIGRGTSTYDGLSIARAVVEYIHNSPALGAKTLFATHYHELVQLAEVLPGVKNFNVAVAEEGGEVVFLHKILPGGVDRSYGIHVAKLAGLPRVVVNRAQEILAELECGSFQLVPKTAARGGKKSDLSIVQQLPLFGFKSPVIKELEELDINSLTPLEALNKLYELQKKARGEAGNP